MNINLSLSPAPSVILKLAVVIYAADAPNVIVSSQEFDPPHLSPRNITFADVEPKTYIVNTYETAGLPDTGTLRHSFIYDPSFIGADIRLTEFLYMVGGSSSYTNTDWIGWTIESIERVGIGTLYTAGVGTNVATREDGFDLVESGDLFGDNEKFVVRFYPKITTIDPVFRSAKVVRSYLILDSDITLDANTHAGVGLRLKGAASHFTVTLPDLTTLENALMFVFISEGGSHFNVTINGGGFNFDFRGAVPEIVLGQNEYLWVGNDNSNNDWVINKISDTAKQTGRIIDQYDNDYEKSCVFANGLLYSRLANKRLYNYVAQLPAGSIVTDGSWTTDKGKYTLGDGSTNFRVPQLFTSGFVRGVDASTRLAGSHQAQAIGPHSHNAKDGDANVNFCKRRVGGPGGGFGWNNTNGFELIEVQTGQTGTNIHATDNIVDNTGVYKMIQA